MKSKRLSGRHSAVKHLPQGTPLVYSCLRSEYSPSARRACAVDTWAGRGSVAANTAAAPRCASPSPDRCAAINSERQRLVRFGARPPAATQLYASILTARTSCHSRYGMLQLFILFLIGTNMYVIYAIVVSECENNY